MKLLKEMNQRTEAEKNGRILSDDNKWHGLLSPGELFHSFRLWYFWKYKTFVKSRPPTCKHS